MTLIIEKKISYRVGVPKEIRKWACCTPEPYHSVFLVAMEMLPSNRHSPVAPKCSPNPWLFPAPLKVATGGGGDHVPHVRSWSFAKSRHLCIEMPSMALGIMLTRGCGCHKRGKLVTRQVVGEGSQKLQSFAVSPGSDGHFTRPGVVLAGQCWLLPPAERLEQAGHPSVFDAWTIS